MTTHPSLTLTMWLARPQQYMPTHLDAYSERLIVSEQRFLRWQMIHTAQHLWYFRPTSLVSLPPLCKLS